MKTFLLLLTQLVPFVVCLQAAQSSTPQAVNKDEFAPLELVIAQVKAALDEYQKNRGAGADALPPLSSAEFDFKTTTGTTVGGTINFFIFKFGASHEIDYVHDVTYTYSLPKVQPPAGLRANKKPPELKEELARTIQSAAQAVKTSANLGKLNFSKLTVNLQYGVKWDINAGGSFQFTFVTVGISGDKNKNTVQSVRLTFG